MAKKGTTKKAGSKSATRRKPAGIKVIHEGPFAFVPPSEKADEASAPKQKRRKPAADAAAPKKMSLLDAAAEGLRKVGGAHNAKAIVTYLAENKIWVSPGGKTPDATLHSAISREIKTKGKDARFRKVGRGAFEFNAVPS